MNRRWLLIVLAFIPECSPFGNNLIAACEDLIKQQLTAPYIYHRVDIHMNVDRDDPGPTNYALVITYEVSTAPASINRDQVICRYFSQDGNVLDASIDNVTLIYMSR